ncbi:MAG: DNA methyltransferase [Flavobacteriaceae bacterium]
MSFSSINIQGNIVSSEILDKIRSEEKYKFQQPEAFGLSRTASLRDEIGLAWSVMRTHWQAYKKRLETLPKGDTGTSLTREKLILPLLTELGYEVAIQRAQQIGGKSYAISHGASNRDLFPIHVMGYNDHLDKRRDNSGPRLSPHALVQEYLNNTEHLYALVTNGRQLRLLRDATRLVRMSYLEFDLERMFEEELYADFSMLYRVLHASRMPEKVDMGAESVIEYYHQESMASGTRIREKLSEAVEDSIKTLANGFLAHPKNESLVALFENHQQKPETYYMHQLRLIYRMLFLIVLEERKLVYPDNLSEDEQRLRTIYYKYYSIERLRKLTENRVYVDADKYDLWESLKTTFLLFEEEQYGSKLGIKPLGSGLFASDALGTLKDLFLKNGDLIEVLKRLTTFVGDQGQLVRVNYSDLDVEEFGSVYEGLLEYDPVVEQIGAQWEFSFVAGEGRSSSGSHYTPEELVKPLIKHSLDYIIADKLKEPNPDQALLSITVCDVACGSGHILLSAARKIATELASLREGAEQPSPTFYRTALRDVIRHCIYGVDLNPLAVELTKVALWIEAHNPGEPLNFLDHHIKCGNAIVGLAHRDELDHGIAAEAFKTLPGDDKAVAKTVRDKNTKELKERKAKEVQLKAEFEKTTTNSVQEAMAEYRTFNKLPETTPEEIKAKQKAYKKFIDGKGYTFLKAMGDVQVAQFFIPKIKENQQRLMTDGEYRLILSGWQGWQDPKVAYATVISHEKHFFHWFLEFPEVFSKAGTEHGRSGGFDCILGNPPYLGGKRISGYYGEDFLQYIKDYYAPAKGSADLISYFVRRYYNICKGYFSFISTNSISQGDTKSASLDILQSLGSDIVYANKNIPWPGLAAVDVTLISYSKEIFNGQKFLRDKPVEFISTLLDDDIDFYPQNLQSNKNKSFQGSIIFGDGFLLSESEYHHLLNLNPKNSNCLFPYLIGDNVNSRPNQNNNRWVINFFNWTESEARKYPELYERVKTLVKPIRDKVKRKVYREKWWLFAEKGVNLYKSIENNDNVLVVPQTTKYLGFTFTNPNQVFAGTLIVFADSSIGHYLSLQSSLHDVWVWKAATTMGSATLRYVNSSYYETFPFPVSESLELIQDSPFYNLKKEIMQENQIGQTEFYNEFHSPQSVISAIKNARTHFSELDNTVLEAYGWHEDSLKWGKTIKLRHDFYEVDYLPENDRIRYTIHPEARKEVLKRLLLLNHERYEEEILQGLHKKEDAEKFYAEKGKELPAEVAKIYAKGYAVSKKKPAKVKEAQTEYKKQGVSQTTLAFDIPEETKTNVKVTLQKQDGTLLKYHICEKTNNVAKDYKHLEPNLPLAEIIRAKEQGGKFQFEGVWYMILQKH